MKTNNFLQENEKPNNEKDNKSDLLNHKIKRNEDKLDINLEIIKRNITVINTFYNKIKSELYK